MNMAKNFQKIHKRCYQWLCRCRKNIIKFSMACNIRVAILSLTWCSTSSWLWRDLPMILTCQVFLRLPIDQSGYRWLRVCESRIIGQPVPLSRLPRRDTVRPLPRFDDVDLNLVVNLILSHTVDFSHRRYACIQNNEASLPLHSKRSSQSDSRIWSGLSFFIYVGTRKDKKIRISEFKCLIRVFPGDLSVVQGFCEV